MSQKYDSLAPLGLELITACQKVLRAGIALYSAYIYIRQNQKVKVIY